MKFLTKEQEQALWDANVAGGLRGASYATAILGPGVWALQQYSPKFRHFPVSLKALGVVTIAVPLVTVCAEKAGEAYARSLWTGAQARWERLSTTEKIKDYLANRPSCHQYGLVGGSWAASMIIAGAVIARNPYLTFPQKLVQARMWALGLTVGVLMGSGVLAGAARKRAASLSGMWTTAGA